ncbi:MAG: glycerol-3-phosphate 1-O-acyltransferase PlsY [Myxococcota bacterium]
MAPLLAYLLLTYALAALPFSVVVTTLVGGEKDVRTEGSKNPGATNAARLYGWGVGGAVMALDVLKGAVPVLGARLLWPELDPWWAAVVAIVAFLAHVFPVYLEFRGGKGVATAAGALLALAPLATLSAAGVWVLTLLLTGRSSVAALGATAAMVGITWWLSPMTLPLVIGIAIAIAVTHTPNLRRLWRGQESKVVRPVRWTRASGDDGVRALQEGPAGASGAAPEVWPGVGTPDTVAPKG